MEAPPSAIPLSVRLPHKPSAHLSCHFFQGTTTTATLVVFLNGLGLPQSGWWPAISNLTAHPPLLTYDRYGQGLTTDTDPQDADPHPSPPGQRHNIVSVVSDLHALITTIYDLRSAIPFVKPPATLPSVQQPTLIFVANSIGCAVARYYAQLYPDTVAALLLLDSYMTDTDFTSLYPDPDAPSFDETTLPDGISVSDIRAAREGMGRLFHPSVVNGEGFWRGDITSLLPHSYEPRLVYHHTKDTKNTSVGEGGEEVEGEEGGPYVTVVGHDWEVFAEESTRMTGMTKAVAMAYTNPAWARYNDGLLKITAEGRAKKLVAEGAGHFIQQGRPDLVADELQLLIEKVDA
ncbi:hypothetical protein TWF696_002896 [Orbilia brochopaga]|uniref:AB hydrolase-1 domain-containing protein n=1 Tax=Orbilia brochopaga TaxID=3140254 RepID=A0AAV9U2C8_9PEZI